MSNAAFTNNFPNPFKSFSQKLFQPTGIAVLASVGIHAALGASLPYLTVSSQEKPKTGTVQVVKLSPAEQSRIPQLSPSSMPNQLGSLYPLPPGLSTPYPPLTSSDLPSNLYPVNSPLNYLANNKRSQSTTSSSPTSATPSLKSPKTNQSTQSTTPKTQQVGKNYAITTGTTRIQPLTDRRSIPLGLSPSLLPPPAQPPLPPPPLYPPTGGNQPIIQAQSNPTFTTSSTTNPTTPTPSSTTNPTTPTPSSTTNTTPTTSPSPSTTTTATSTPTPGNTRSLPRNTTTATAPATALPALPSNSSPAPAPSQSNGTNNGTGNSNDDYQRRTIAALANMGKVETLERYATILGNYPKAACVEKLSGKSIVTAQVDAQGNVGDITVTVPSNIPVFDDVAQMTVSGMNFGAKGKSIAYQVPVEFKYDSNVCGSAAVPQNSAQPQNARTPQNSSTPKKSPEASNTATPQDSPAPKKSPEG